MQNFVLPIVTSLIAGSATIIGLVLVLYAKDWVKKNSFSIVSLAAGVLLGTAFLHLLPEAYELIQEDLFFWALVGMAIFFCIEAFIGFHACKEEDFNQHEHVLGPVASMGILIHSLLDGIAIAIGYEIDPKLGLITALAVMVHELPEGIFTFSILVHGQMKLKKATQWTVAVALATPVGTALTLLFTPNLEESALGILLGIAAVSFIYIAASDLIPESPKSRSLTTAVCMVLGLVLIFFLVGTYFFLMCFSASASFVVSGALVVGGSATLTYVKKKTELPAALVPLLFAVQQFVEGLQWLAEKPSDLSQNLGYAYLAFAYLLWPVYIPIAVLLLEKNKTRKNLLKLFLAIGIAVSLYLLYILLTQPISVTVAENHIAYLTEAPGNFVSLIPYLLALCGSLFISSDKFLRLFGLFVLAAFVYSYFNITQGFGSVWCFFAAVTSILVYFYFMRRARH